MKANDTSTHDKYYVQSVDNALLLLEAMSDSKQELHLSQLSERIGLSKSTVYRLLVTFQRRGYIEQDHSSHRYRLGMSAFEVGQKCLSRMALLDKARPIMDQLARQSRESVYLAVRKNDEILLIGLADTPQQVKVTSMLGRRFPIRSSAAGLVLAAFSKGEQPTVVSLQGLNEIRNHGIAMVENDIAEGIVSLAAPLLDYDNRIQGALLIISPDFRVSTDQLRVQQTQLLLAAAESISSRLGYLKGRFFSDRAHSTAASSRQI
ncbi:MAG TPA: IclR family transcriptional regulator [Geothermobacteraceae bacterium]|nr:IclR family transcriptional regulator [Geothermobacteraceae bacterium]